MKKDIRNKDKFKYKYFQRCNDEENWKHRQQHIWKCPDSIKTSRVVDGRFSKGQARNRKQVKTQARRRSRRAWNRNHDMLDVRFDKKCVDMWFLCD